MLIKFDEHFYFTVFNSQIKDIYRKTLYLLLVRNIQ